MKIMLVISFQKTLNLFYTLDFKEIPEKPCLLRLLYVNYALEMELYTWIIDLRTD